MFQRTQQGGDFTVDIFSGSDKHLSTSSILSLTTSSDFSSLSTASAITYSVRLCSISPSNPNTSGGLSCLGGLWSLPCHSLGMCMQADRKSSTALGSNSG